MIVLIVKGILDVNVISRGNSNVELLTGCGGSPLPSLAAITSGPVTLRRRNTAVHVNLESTEGGECIEQTLSVGRDVAQRLMLRNLRRYRVVFNTETRVMRLFRKPVTRVRLFLGVGTQVVEDREAPNPKIITIQDDQIFISAIGQVALGIIRDRLLLKHGLASKSLRILRGQDIFIDPFIQVTPRTAKQLGLTEGNVFMEFNQNTSILRINPGK